MLDLGQIRNEIDGIDKQLVELFEQRMKLTKEVAEYKIQTGKKVLDREREKAKIESVTKLVKNKENVHAIDDLFSQIMANSRKGQYQLLEAMGQTLRQPYEAIDEIKKDGVKIVYQGIPGAYTQEAACNFFGEDCDNYDVPTWRDVMEAVKNKEADYGVLPIENSTTGSVVGVYDLLQEYDNYIIAETFVNIDHVLVGLSGTDIDKVTTVYSHPQGIMQCDKFLNTHKDWQRINQANTAMAARMLLSENDKTHVAISSKKAAQIYGLEVLDECIQNNKNNSTRFIIVSGRKICRKDSGRISICFEIPHKSGSLYHMLSHFIYNGVNMTNIQSRPIQGRNWEYRFFIDFEGKFTDDAVQNALRGLKEETIALKILGTY